MLRRPAHLTLAALSLAASTLIGCSSTVKQSPSQPIGALGLESLKRVEYSVLDTVEGTGEVYWICGFKFGDDKYGHIDGRVFEKNDAKAAAMFDALSKVPNADTILPLTTTITQNGFIPFYWRETAKVRGKAIQIKSDKELGK
jgi:hypothetical protein